MGNIGVNIKKFLSNKNTVAIICVIAGILVLYLGYTWRVNNAINPTLHAIKLFLEVISYNASSYV